MIIGRLTFGIATGLAGFLPNTVRTSRRSSMPRPSRATTGPPRTPRGDNPNRLPLVELEQRWEISPGHHYYERGHRRVHARRSDHAHRFRRLETRRRRYVPGVWQILRNEDRHISRGLPHRPLHRAPNCTASYRIWSN